MKRSPAGNILFLFTTTYPYGKFEQNLHVEAEFLSAAFEKVYVFSAEQGGAQRKMPPNFVAVDISAQASFRKTFFFTRFFSFLWIYLGEIWNTPLPRKPLLLSVKDCFRKMFHAFCTAKALDELIKKEGLSDKKIHFYSYWFYHWPLIFAFFKKYGSKKVNTVSRGHMADMYQYPYDFPFNPFHYFKLKSIDRFFATSKDGADYLRSKFGEFSGKISVSRSGIPSREVNPFPTDEFVIVSCSTLQRRKRVYLMPDILRQLDFKVRWVHFGDGPGTELVVEGMKGLPPHIQVELKGFVGNEGLFRYYALSPISVFINLSTAEGLPFSIIEAIAFGIPVIATDVYGTPEVCSPESGMLLPKDLNVKIVADTIKRFRSSAMNSLSFRAGVKTFWDREFNSDRNYPDFIDRAFGPGPLN